MLLGSAFTAEAAGPQVDAAGWYWQEDDGSRAVSSWKDYNGNRYYFGEDGYMYANRWAEIPYYQVYLNPWSGEVAGGDFINYFYLFDVSGALVTSGNWEGGSILADGRLYCDDGPEFWTGQLTYWRSADYSSGEPIGIKMNDYGDSYMYAGILGWKNQMVQQFNAVLSAAGYAYGTHTMDFQLPANYADECPGPLITAALSSVCRYAWEDDLWSFNWNVDDNYVIHIVASAEPYTGEWY